MFIEVTVELSERAYAGLINQADREGYSIGAIMRQALRAYLAAQSSVGVSIPTAATPSPDRSQPRGGYDVTGAREG